MYVEQRRHPPTRGGGVPVPGSSVSKCRLLTELGRRVSAGSAGHGVDASSAMPPSMALAAMPAHAPCQVLVRG